MHSARPSRHASSRLSTADSAVLPFDATRIQDFQSRARAQGGLIEAASAFKTYITPASHSIFSRSITLPFRSSCSLTPSSLLDSTQYAQPIIHYRLSLSPTPPTDNHPTNTTKNMGPQLLLASLATTLSLVSAQPLPAHAHAHVAAPTTTTTTATPPFPTLQSAA